MLGARASAIAAEQGCLQKGAAGVGWGGVGVGGGGEEGQRSNGLAGQEARCLREVF